MKKISLFKTEIINTIFGWEHKKGYEFLFNTEDNILIVDNLQISREDFLRGFSTIPYEKLGEFTVEDLTAEHIQKII